MHCIIKTPNKGTTISALLHNDLLIEFRLLTAVSFPDFLLFGQAGIVASSSVCLLLMTAL